MPTVYIASRNSISSGISSGSRVYNPCGEGFGPSTLLVETQFGDGTLKNISFIVCAPTDGSQKTNMDLALGLGLGIPLALIALVLYFFVYRTRRNPIVQFNPNIVPVGNEPIAVAREVDPKKALFDKLGYHSHKQFLAGNLTAELKISLKSFTVEELGVLEKFSFDHNKHEISRYISQEIVNKTGCVNTV
jgi:hypothetical protein